VSKSGKSLVGEEIAAKNRLSIFSTDWLMMTLALNKSNNVNPAENDDIVSANMHSFLFELISQIISSGNNYVIEGVHITPELANSLIAEYPESIKSCFLGYKNLTVQEKDSELQQHKDKIKNTWFFDLNKNQYNDFLTEVIDRSKVIYEKCKKLNLKYFEITDIIQQKQDIINYLLN